MVSHTRAGYFAGRFGNKESSTHFGLAETDCCHSDHSKPDELMEDVLDLLRDATVHLLLGALLEVSNRIVVKRIQFLGNILQPLAAYLLCLTRWSEKVFVSDYHGKNEEDSAGEFDPGALIAPPNIITSSADCVETEGLACQVESMEKPRVVSPCTIYKPREWGSSGEFDPGPLNAPPNIVTCTADWVENEGLVRQVESMESPCAVSSSTIYNPCVSEDVSEQFESTMPTATTATGETPKPRLA